MASPIGRVVAPSGKLLIVEPGYLDHWCHDRSPRHPMRGIVTAQQYAREDDAVDLEIVGRDAEAVGRAYDRQWHPRFLFDTRRERIELEREQIAALAEAKQLDARIEVLPARVSHRARIDLALQQGHGGGEVEFSGIWSGVAAVPARSLSVSSEDMPADGPDDGRWRRVVVTASDAPVARSEQFGHAVVDWGRLLLIDADALGLWVRDEPLDGLADFVFWGHDAAAIAERIGANALPDGEFGWVDRPHAEIQEHRRRFAIDRGDAESGCASDYRPHSHYHLLNEQIRASNAGEVELGPAIAFGFGTTWGDGMFELHRDLDAAGNLVRIRIELGTEKRQALMRRMELRTFKCALVSRMVADEMLPVRFLYRKEPSREEDSGWRMFSAEETEEYTDDAENIAVVRLSTLAERDKRVDALLDEPVGSVFERATGDDDFERVTDWQPEDD
jgi:hypothetical protein